MRQFSRGDWRKLQESSEQIRALSDLLRRHALVLATSLQRFLAAQEFHLNRDGPQRHAAEFVLRQLHQVLLRADDQARHWQPAPSRPSSD